MAVQVAADVLEASRASAAAHRRRAPESRPPRPRARRDPRAAPARCRRAAAARTAPPRSRRCWVRPIASSSTPYSETCSPRRTAASRSAALWRAEPVKCCSRLPSWEGLAIRRSTPTPEWVRALRARSAGRADALDLRQPREALGERRGAGRRRDQVEVLDAVGPAARRARRGARRCPGLPAAVSPAIERLTDLDRLRQQYPRGRALAARRPRAPPARSPRAWVRARAPCAGVRAAPPRAASPASRRRAPSTAAARAWARCPGRRVIAISPLGNFARSFSVAGIVPCVEQREDLLLRASLPIAGSSVARPARASAATDTGASRTLLAAAR